MLGREFHIRHISYMGEMKKRVLDVPNVCSCAMCKRLIINAGISTVVVRENETEYTKYDVRDWIINDDSLTGKFGY